MTILFVLMYLAASWFTADLLGVDLFPTALVITGAIFALAGGHGGGLGIGDAIAEVRSGITGLLRFIVRIVVTYIVFGILMMPISRLLKVDPYYVAEGIRIMGVRIWGHSSQIGLPFILYMLCALVVAAIATRVAHGEIKAAAPIIVSAIAILFALIMTPPFAAVFLPVKVDASGNAVSDWKSTTKRLQKSGLGGTVGCAMWHGMWGEDTSFLWVFCKPSGETQEQEQPKPPKKGKSAVKVVYVPVESTATIITEDEDYPRSGRGCATKDAGLRIYADTRNSFIRPTRDSRVAEAMYCQADNTDVCWTDSPDSDLQVWRHMESGNYIVYPVGDDEIQVHWGIK